MFDSRVLAQRILLSRRDLDWDQQRLADESGVSRTYISQIERGRKTNIGIDVIVALAHALGVQVAWLVGEAADALGENPERVLREEGGEYLTLDVDSQQQRRLLQEAFDALSALSPAAQISAVKYLRVMRRIEEEGDNGEAPPPRIVE